MTAVRRFAGAYQRLPEAEAALSRTESFAQRQSHRLAAVWRISHDAAISDAERLQAILDAGCETIRPGRPFYGKISHREGDELVVDLVSTQAAHFGNDPPFLWKPNERVPFAATLSAAIAEPGQSMRYSDVADYQRVTGRPSVSTRNWESAVRASFAVANVTYFIAFASTEPVTEDPFTEDDLAFIDVLAAFITSHVQQSRQLAQLRYQIEHDLLTGLPNRAAFRAAAIKPIALDVPCAIAIIDLDHFRQINESFGHMIGDALLVEIAAALRNGCQIGDVIARMHGDTFALLIDDVRAGADVEARLQPFRDVFSKPHITGDRTGKEALHVGASFGVALFPGDGRTFDELLAHADAAVDSAKGRHRGSTVFFNNALQASVERRRLLHTELARAVTAGELVLHYQPTIDLPTGNVVGAEALVRWQHPERGLVPPDEFIPFAEANGLIRAIGRWVMHRAVSDMAGFGAIPRGFICNVNLSGHQLGDLEFVSEMRSLLAATPQAMDRIGVEITETVAMQDVERTLDALSILRDMGILIALDDFGTGYSSLSYLKRLPIDVIKIDRSFVAGLPSDPHDVALVETLLEIARRFGFRTLAEGIETHEQLVWLRSLGCTYGQGFLIAKPMAFDDLTAWIERSRVATR